MTGTCRQSSLAFVSVERRILARLSVMVLALWTADAPATLLYVDAGSANPNPPYADWSTAATNIQDAIDAASSGDLIWVTNGVYRFGGKAVASTLTNRVTLDKSLTVQSVNGPFVTSILGAGATNGPSAVRCAWLTDGAGLIGFTLRAGATLTGGGAATQNGGGVWCASSNATVANCILEANTASSCGGAAYQGTLNNCWIISNSVPGSFGGGACNSFLNNCTVVSNSGVGVYQAPSAAMCANCIIYFNLPFNYSAGIFSYSCTTPLPSGAGCFTNAPQLLADNLHLASSSPCRGAGISLPGARAV